MNNLSRYYPYHGIAKRIIMQRDAQAHKSDFPDLGEDACLV